MRNYNNPLSFLGRMSTQAMMSAVAAMAIVVVSLVFVSQRVEAAATPTAATGGGAISVDSAATATTPAWTTLGPIVITEGLAADITAEGPVTMIFTAPAGFEFNTGQATDFAATGADITLATTPATIAATTITVTYTAGAAVTSDVLTIGGITPIQVRPTGGTPATGSIFRTGGSGVAIAGITGATNFGTLTSIAGTMTKLGVTTEPAAATAGAVFGTQPVVTTQDQFGNNTVVGLGAALTVTGSLTTGSGTLQGTLGLDIGTGAGNGTVTYTDLRNDVAEAGKVITFAATGPTSALTAGFTVSPAVGNKLILSTAPSASTVAGVAFAQQPIVQIQDAFNNIVTSDSATVVTAALTTGTGALTGTVTKTAASGIADFSGNGMKIDLVGADKVLTFTGGGFTAAVSGAFTITLAPASQIVLTTQPSASTVAGVAFAAQPVAEIRDALGNVVTTDSSTVVTATLTTGTGTLSGTVTKTAASGIVDFSGNAMKIDLVGANKVLTLSGGGLTNGVSGAFTITVAAASKLAVTTQPTASTVAGVAIATQPIVTIQDAFGNTITTDSATVVTLALTTGSGALTGTATKTAASGIADFAGQGLKIDLVGADKVLTATGGGYTSAATGAFTITFAAASQIVLTTQPSASSAPSTAFAQQPVMQIQDAFGNTITTDSGTVVTAALTSGTGTLAGTATKTAASGIVDFSGNGLKIDLTGAGKVLTFSGGGFTAAVSNAFTIAAATASGATSTITASPTSFTVSSGSSTITVQLKDGGGTNLSSGGDTVVLSTDVGSLSSVTDNGDGTYTATLTSGAMGTATVSGTVNAGAITDTATVTVDAASAPAPTPTADEPGFSVELENTETAETSTTVEVAVATTSSDGSTADVTVPAGALPEGSTLEVSAISNAADLETKAPPPATVDVTLAFSIKATASDGSAVTDDFSEPVALSFTVDASTVPAGATGEQLKLAFWNGLRWVLVEGTVTVNADGTATINATTNHFTLFAVLYHPDGFGLSFEGELPTTGVGFVTFGGTTAQLETALVNQSCISPIFVTSGGEWIGFIPTVQFAAVNAAFNTLFADGIPLGTPMVATGCND